MTPDRDLTPSQLVELQKEHRPMLLDVRSRAEYNAGHIAGAIHMPFWAVPWRYGSLAVERDQPIVIYCGHGPRAYFARAALERRGFAQVACLAGHMSGWRRDGREVVRDGE